MAHEHQAAAVCPIICGMPSGLFPRHTAWPGDTVDQGLDLCLAMRCQSWPCVHAPNSLGFLQAKPTHAHAETP